MKNVSKNTLDSPLLGCCSLCCAISGHFWFQKSTKEVLGRLDSMAKGLRVLIVISIIDFWTRQVKEHQCQQEAEAQACSGLAKIGFTRQQTNPIFKPCVVPVMRFDLPQEFRYMPNIGGSKKRKYFCFWINVGYVSGMCPRGVSAGPRSRYFSSRDGSVVLPCRWISGLVCNSTQPLPRPRLSSWFLRLKMFILLSSSGLAFSEPVGLGSLRLTGSTTRPFWARQESSEREDNSSCTTMLGSLQGSWPEKVGGQQRWEL